MLLTGALAVDRQHPRIRGAHAEQREGHEQQQPAAEHDHPPVVVREGEEEDRAADAPDQALREALHRPARGPAAEHGRNAVGVVPLAADVHPPHLLPIAARRRRAHAALHVHIVAGGRVVEVRHERPICIGVRSGIRRRCRRRPAVRLGRRRPLLLPPRPLLPLLPLLAGAAHVLVLDDLHLAPRRAGRIVRGRRDGRSAGVRRGEARARLGHRSRLRAGAAVRLSGLCLLRHSHFCSYSTGYSLGTASTSPELDARSRIEPEPAQRHERRPRVRVQL